MLGQTEAVKLLCFFYFCFGLIPFQGRSTILTEPDSELAFANVNSMGVMPVKIVNLLCE